MPTAPSPERNLLHAFFYGSAVVLTVMAGVLTLVGAVLWACGDAASSLALGLLPLGGAGVMAFYARLARDS